MALDVWRRELEELKEMLGEISREYGTLARAGFEGMRLIDPNRYISMARIHIEDLGTYARVILRIGRLADAWRFEDELRELKMNVDITIEALETIIDQVEIYVRYHLRGRGRERLRWWELLAMLFRIEARLVELMGAIDTVLSMME